MKSVGLGEAFFRVGREKEPDPCTRTSMIDFKIDHLLV